MGRLLVLLPKIISIVPSVVSLVERLFPGEKRGAEKRVVAVEILKWVIVFVEGASNKDLVENEAFAVAVGQIIDGVVGALNAINRAEVPPVQ